MSFTFTNMLNRYAVRSKPPILQWVAGGRGSAGIIVTSTNGTSWTAASSNGGISSYVYGVANGGMSSTGWGVRYGEGRWVAVGNGTQRIVSSTDGINWSAPSSNGGLTNLGIDVAFKPTPV